MIKVTIEQNEKELLKASGNYLDDLECYEVEIIKNNLPCDTSYRIELIDNDYINITETELKTLKELLNNETVSKLLKL